MPRQACDPIVWSPTVPMQGASSRLRSSQEQSTDPVISPPCDARTLRNSIIAMLLGGCSSTCSSTRHAPWQARRRPAPIDPMTDVAEQLAEAACRSKSRSEVIWHQFSHAHRRQEAGDCCHCWAFEGVDGRIGHAFGSSPPFRITAKSSRFGRHCWPLAQALIETE